MRSTPDSGSREFAQFLCVGIGAGLLFVSSTSFAQDSEADTAFEQAELVVEEVTVTGTRIKRRDFSSPSPLATVDREEFEFSGQPTLEEYLNRMPQILPDVGRTSNNPGNGTATLNLRGMGAGGFQQRELSAQPVGAQRETQLGHVAQQDLLARSQRLDLDGSDRFGRLALGARA